MTPVGAPLRMYSIVWCGNLIAQWSIVGSLTFLATIPSHLHRLQQRSSPYHPHDNFDRLHPSDSTSKCTFQITQLFSCFSSFLQSRWGGGMGAMATVKTVWRRWGNLNLITNLTRSMSVLVGDSTNLHISSVKRSQLTGIWVRSPIEREHPHKGRRTTTHAEHYEWNGQWLWNRYHIGNEWWHGVEHNRTVFQHGNYRHVADWAEPSILHLHSTIGWWVLFDKVNVIQPSLMPRCGVCTMALTPEKLSFLIHWVISCDARSVLRELLAPPD